MSFDASNDRLNAALSYSKRIKRRRWVYFLECDGFVKVGIAFDVHSRIAMFQTGSPHPISLLHAFIHPDAERAERVIHNSFARYKVSGEWFKLPAGVMQSLRIAGLKSVGHVGRIVVIAKPKRAKPVCHRVKRFNPWTLPELAPVVLPFE